MAACQSYGYETIINEICLLDWPGLSEAELTGAAWAYYFFSVQFRENLQIACKLYPDDPLLKRLEREECCTDNLSPWPRVAALGEKLNHDDFVKRLLGLSPISPDLQQAAEEAGRTYLSRIREIDEGVRALSIASYEDGGLERVFRAMLQSKNWDTALLQAFRHFLVCHIAFDSNPDEGHGALARHLPPLAGVASLWLEFKQLLTDTVPGLRRVPITVAAAAR